MSERWAFALWGVRTHSLLPSPPASPGSRGGAPTDGAAGPPSVIVPPDSKKGNTHGLVHRLPDDELAAAAADPEQEAWREANMDGAVLDIRRGWRPDDVA
jgi:hypothetical protein